jgi:hypothetical protein
VAEHRERTQLLGDFLREVAVLIIVLYPLESGINRTFRWWVFILVAVGTGIFLFLGILLEGKDGS